MRESCNPGSKVTAPEFVPPPKNLSVVPIVELQKVLLGLVGSP